MMAWMFPWQTSSSGTEDQYIETDDFFGSAASSIDAAAAQVVGERWQRWIDVFATLVLLFVVIVQTAMLFDKVRLTYSDNVLSYDLNRQALLADGEMDQLAERREEVGVVQDPIACVAAGNVAVRPPHDETDPQTAVRSAK